MTDLATTAPRASAAEPEAGGYELLDWGLFAALALIWGSSFLWIDVGLDNGLAPGAVTFLRIVLGTVALAFVPRARAHVPWGDRLRMFGLGALWVGVPFTLFPLAQQHVDSAVAGMINGAVPLATALWASLLTRSLPRSHVAVGLAVGFAGVVTIALPRLSDGGSTALGIGLVLLAVLMYGLSLNVAVPLQRRHGSEATMLNVLGSAVVVTAPFGAVGLADSTFTPVGLGAMLPLGVLGTGLAMVLMTTFASRVGPSQAAVAIYATPVVATVLGVAFLGDDVGPAAVLGTALVIAGAATTSRG